MKSGEDNNEMPICIEQNPFYYQIWLIINSNYNNDAKVILNVLKVSTI